MTKQSNNENNIEKCISTQEIFPVIMELLKQGKKVIFNVSGMSMAPWIMNNRDRVLLSGAMGQALKIGDIILFQNSRGDYILHRIYKKKEILS